MAHICIHDFNLLNSPWCLNMLKGVETGLLSQLISTPSLPNQPMRESFYGKLKDLAETVLHIKGVKPQNKKTDAKTWPRDPSEMFRGYQNGIKSFIEPWHHGWPLVIWHMVMRSSLHHVRPRWCQLELYLVPVTWWMFFEHNHTV